MDYMKELNAFRNWQLLNPLSTGEVALWHTLMSLNNMTGWKEWFVVPNSTVQLLTGMSKQGVDNARNKLIQRKLIDYQKGNKSEAGRYKMLPASELVNFSTQKFDQTVDQMVDHFVDDQLTNPGTDACPLLDKDIDKNKTEDILPQPQLGAREVFRAFERGGFGTLSSLLADELGDLVDTYSVEWVIEAMKEAARCGKRNLKYVHAILKRWSAEGIDQPWQAENSGQTAPVPSGTVARVAARTDKPRTPVQPVSHAVPDADETMRYIRQQEELRRQALEERRRRERIAAGADP